ncbi:MAG: HlyC/CorC family transporter, partial [Acidobacteria bacterium]
EGSRGARWVKHLQDNMDRFLATVQIGVTLMGTLAGVLGGYLASRYFEPVIQRSAVMRWLPPALEAATLVGLAIVYVELILGELVPKALALRYTDTVAVIVAWPLDMLARFSRVLIAFLTTSTRAVLFLFGIRDIGHRTFVSEEEIKHLVKEGRQQGVLDQTEEELIHSVFEFSETPVKKVMVPRPKIFALDVNTPPEDVAHAIIESGFSRVPVYDGTPDNMVGVVYVKDVLRLLEKKQPVVLRKILHPVHFVPETKKVGELLKELQKRRTHLALVIDEHGSLVGLVTLEDLLEEIVGEIQDEYDWEERPVEKLRDGSLVVDGTVSAADLRQKYDIPIPESEDFNTVAGFMLDCLGAVPRGGEVVQVGDYRLTVVDVEKNRISKVKIDKAPTPVKV